MKSDRIYICHSEHSEEQDLKDNPNNHSKLVRMIEKNLQTLMMPFNVGVII